MAIQFFSQLLPFYSCPLCLTSNPQVFPVRHNKGTLRGSLNEPDTYYTITLSIQFLNAHKMMSQPSILVKALIPKNPDLYYSDWFQPFLVYLLLRYTLVSLSSLHWVICVLFVFVFLHWSIFRLYLLILPTSLFHY